jgi:hypothetical protein
LPAQLFFTLATAGACIPFGEPREGLRALQECQPLLFSNVIVAKSSKDPRKIMSTIWSAMLLVLLAVITAVWVSVLGFGLMHLIEQMI